MFSLFSLSGSSAFAFSGETEIGCFSGGWVLAHPRLQLVYDNILGLASAGVAGWPKEHVWEKGSRCCLGANDIVEGMFSMRFCVS